MTVSNTMKIKQSDGNFKDVKISYIKPNGCTEEGMNTTASNTCAHAEGLGTTAEGVCAHTEGMNTRASHYAHAEGEGSIAGKNFAHAEGFYTQAMGAGSHAEGDNTQAIGQTAHSEGTRTSALGDYSHAEGFSTNRISEEFTSISTLEEIHNAWSEKGMFGGAYGIASHTEGADNIAFDDYSHSEGNATIAFGGASHAEGRGTIAQGLNSHSEGEGTMAIGLNSHAEGIGTEAFGKYSHVEGSFTKVFETAYSSHAEGESTEVRGSYSHAGGFHTVASGTCQTVIGRYNDYERFPVDDTYLFLVGNGEDENNRSLAAAIDKTGYGHFNGIYADNADYAEYFEWEDKNLSKEDRIGYIVSLNKNKIQKAQREESVLGIISGTAGILGDNYEWSWKNKYLTDDFGRIIYEEKEDIVEQSNFDEEGNKIIEKISLGMRKVPKLNPEYNPEQQYISRADRSEWDIVGLMGKIYVRDDGTCIPGEYATVGTEPGVATHSEEKTNIYVMERTADNVVRVFLK